MEKEVKLPELGSGIKSADVVEVLVRVGDVVEQDQGLLEIETDKATATVPSPLSGRVSRIVVERGQTLAIDALLMMIDAKEAAPVVAPARAASLASVAAAIAPQATPVASSPPATPAAGSSAAPERREPEPAESASVAAGPAIRKFAREVGIDLRTVRGSGEHGRITRDDVLNAVRQASRLASSRGKTDSGAGTNPTETLLTDDWGQIRVEKMSKIRRTIAAKMLESSTTVPRVTNFDDVDVTELERIRQSSKEDYAERGIKLTSLPFVIKAIAMSLKAHPILNASLDPATDSIIYKEYVHVGVAIDSERGLVVPSLRNADQLAIPEIARQLQKITERVRGGSYTVDDLRGSTFTVSNLGAIGGTYSTPIVNTPEVAILLLGRARKLPVVVDDEIAIRLMMPLSLSYDHRLVDGGAAARFLNDVIGFLKAPGRLLLAP